MFGRLPANLALRRREEARQADASVVVAERKKIAGYVEFEHRTDKKIRGQLLKQRIQESNKLLREQVNQRRARLAALLEAERKQFDVEIEASFETPEQVKERLFAQARIIKARREEERRQLVKELEAKRFALASDELRSHKQTITNQRVALDRISQLQEKARLQAQADEMRREEERARLEALQHENSLERAKEEARRRLAAETAQYYHLQSRARNDRLQAEAERDHGIVRDMLEQDAEAARRQKDQERLRREQARESLLSTLAQNEVDALQRKERERQELLRDRDWVRDIQSQAEQEEQRERRRAEERRLERAREREYLEMMAQRNQEKAAELDHLFQKDNDQQWAKREAIWKAESEARQLLMEDVYASRERQIEEQMRRDEARRLEELEYGRRMREEAMEQERQEAERRRQQKQGGLVAGVGIRQQLREREDERKAREQVEYLEWKREEKDRREYEAKVADLIRQEGERVKQEIDSTVRVLQQHGAAPASATTNAAREYARRSMQSSIF